MANPGPMISCQVGTAYWLRCIAYARDCDEPEGHQRRGSLFTESIIRPPRRAGLVKDSLPQLRDK